VLRIVALLACVPAGAHADAKQSSTHAMRWLEDTNIHIAGGGAIDRHVKVTIAVEVFSSGKVIVTDTGTRKEHDLYDSYSTDRVTTWTTIWDGKWKLAGRMLTLDLAPRSQKCKREKKYSDAAPQSEPCRPIDKQVTITCGLGKVELAGKPAKQVDAWSCAFASTLQIGETQRSWTLGNASCLQVRFGLADPQTIEACK
jgi:hypothetical protein